MNKISAFLPAALLTFLLGLLPGLLLAGCGGGGGGSTPGGSIPPSTLVQETQDVLDLCLNDALSAFLDVSAVLQLAPGSAAPDITVLDVNGLIIPFVADLDGDGATDAVGGVTIFDPTGAQVMPFTNAEIQNDATMLLAALASLPSNTRVDVSIDPIPSRGIQQAEFSQTLQGGVPDALNGLLITQTADCQTTIQYANETILSILGTYPNLTAGIEITTDTGIVAGIVTGTIFFNGTVTAVAELSLNGTGPVTFQVDLETGAITPTGG